MLNTFFKKLTLWLLIAMAGLFLLNLFMPHGEKPRTITYNEFMDHVASGDFAKITIRGNEAIAQDRAGGHYKTGIPADADMVQSFVKAGVKVLLEPNPEPPWYMASLVAWVPILLLVVAGFFYMRQQSQGGGGKGIMSMGKSRARLIEGEESKVSFKDVAGIEEARDELSEIVDFLKKPAMFAEVGAKIPKGVLLSGEPGTGKTLLAKAIAGEAGVPFFSISGSDFVEMYVGVGASRVRDLFRQAKKKAPCIIFIDEIDAVGRQRSAGGVSGNDEREQTLNQLLVEMDGFEANSGIIIVAATNRPDILDPALKRPGRFDRQVTVPLPDVNGREMILKVHAAKIPLDDDADFHTLAKATPGFSGAELANLVNEAALMAARTKAKKIGMDLFEKAKDKVMMGAARTSMILTPQEKEVTAYHEAGHALIAELLPGTDPVHKITILPRGRALGMTLQLPEVEKHSQSRSYLLNNIRILLGGRVAEEIVFGEITTGSGNDIERASAIARKMVCELGMSEELGPLTFPSPSEHAATGTAPSYYGEDTAESIDRSVKNLVLEAHQDAHRLLAENKKKLEALALALIDHETIGRAEIQKLLSA